MTLISGFHMPQRMELEDLTRTPNYAKFTAAPFQTGYGHTIGNSLRRILLSSLDGAALSAVRIEGVPHEFMSADGIVEDITEVVLNLKKVKLICHGDTPRILTIRKSTCGKVFARDIDTDGTVDIVNPDQIICTLDKNMDFQAELEVIKGRGYRPAEKNKFLDEVNKTERPMGWIAIDSIFSPVSRVRYEVGAARAGEDTELDKLVIEVWTDGRIDPEEAVKRSAKILQDHLKPFLGCEIREEDSMSTMTEEKKNLFRQFAKNIESLELSVRSQNCLDNAGIRLIGELCMRTEKALLKYKNFGNKSLDEIKEKLVPMGLELGMVVDDDIVQALNIEIDKYKSQKVAEEIE